MNDFLENFHFESEEQEKGVRAFLQWARRNSVSPELRPIDLFFIQSDHDSHVWFIEMLGSQISSLQGELRALQGTVAKQAGEIAVLKGKRR